MKKLYLVLPVLLMNLSSGAQFLDEDKQWNVRKELNFGPVWTSIYKIQGDTTIGEWSYKIILENIDSASNDWYPAGYLREEASRVYYRYYDQDGLLYDFSLAAGDTIEVVSIDCWEPQEKIVFSVDTVEYYGISRTRWNFDEENWDCWIEGIGSLYGPLNSIFPCYTDFWTDLLCFYEDDSLLYLNAFSEDCYVTTVGIRENATGKGISFGPNPVPRGEIFKVVIENPVDKLEIAGLSDGRTWRTYPVSTGEFKIDPGPLPAGIYLLKFFRESRCIQTEKIVIL